MSASITGGYQSLTVTKLCNVLIAVEQKQDKPSGRARVLCWGVDDGSKKRCQAYNWQNNPSSF